MAAILVCNDGRIALAAPVELEVSEPSLREAAVVGPDVQTTLPGEGGAVGQPTSTPPPTAAPNRKDDRRAPGSGDRQWRSETKGDSQMGVVGGISQFLLYGVLIVGALLLLVTIVSEMSGLRHTTEKLADTSAGPATNAQVAAVISKPLDDADALAASGKFSEAIHTLLALTLYELATQSAVRLTGAMTSREILTKVSMLGDARSALSDLVTAVELTWFGDDVANDEDYQRCRQQFSLFAIAYKKGAERRSGFGTSQGGATSRGAAA